MVYISWQDGNQGRVWFLSHRLNLHRRTSMFSFVKLFEVPELFIENIST